MIHIKIAIHDGDREHLKTKVFPNYALMKIAAHHKQQGDCVEWWLKYNSYDRVYSSKIFDFTPENPKLPMDTIKGGTGYPNVELKLPSGIDGMFPDYSIYPDCDYAIGYLTRGCIRNCPWCAVPQKEGYITPYRTWQELLRGDSDKLVLMDNNILACSFGIDQLESLIGSGYRIDINQGLDARLVNDHVCEILKQLKWIEYIRFSCDQISQIEDIRRVYELFKKHRIGVSKMFIYVLVTKDLVESDFRIQELNKLKSINIYAQAERNATKGIIPNTAQIEFAQRYVYGKSYKKENWVSYCERTGFNDQQ